jgi:hypothetical protein
MARIRTIKPEFFKNEDIAEMPAMTRLLFIGLWTQSDRAGRLMDRPKRLKAEIFPYDNFDVNKGLEELQKKGFIIRYKVNVNVTDRVLSPEQPDEQQSIIQIVNFLKHQQPNVKESPSTIPAQCKHGASITGRERKGKEGKGDNTPPTSSDTDSSQEQTEKNSPPIPPPPPKSVGPPIDEVTQFMISAGGTTEMAGKFWNKYEGLGWKQGFSKIVNWRPFANNYIANYIENDKKNGTGRKQTTTGSIQAVDTATAELIRDLDAAASEQHPD